MAKFFGKVGYSVSEEKTIPIIPEIENGEEVEYEGTGIWVDTLSERDYTGDVIREAKNWQTSDKANDNLTVTNRVSIVADNFAYENFSAMKYIIWYGVYWKISSVEIQRPRIILILGGVYNGPTYVAPPPPS